MNHSRHLLAVIAVCWLLPPAEGIAENVPPAKKPPAGEIAEGKAPDTKPALADFPSLLGALSETANPRWRQLYRPPVRPQGDRNLGAVALGGVIADIYLASEAYDTRQVKNLCMEIESHARVLGINEGSAGETRRLADAAGKEDWKGVAKTTAELRTRLHDLLITQRDPDLAILIEIGFWLRGLEIASAAVLSESEATDLPLCIGSPARLKHLAGQIDELAEPIQKLPFIVDTGEEIDRLIRRWDTPTTTATREDVDASHTKVRNLIRRIFER